MSDYTIEELEHLYQKMICNYRQNKFDKALKIAIELINNNFKNENACIIYINSAIEIGMYDEAFEFINLVSDVFPNSIGIKLSEIEFLIRLKKIDCAQVKLNMLSKNNSDSRIDATKVFLYLSLHDYKQAFRLIDEYIKQNNNNVKFRISVAFRLLLHARSLFVYENYLTSEPRLIICDKNIYKRCKKLSEKAYSLYSCEETQKFKDYVHQFGTLKFEFRQIDIFIFSIAGILCISFLTKHLNIYSFFATLTIFGFIFKCSFRPLWKIIRENYTGLGDEAINAVLEIKGFLPDIVENSFDNILGDIGYINNENVLKNKGGRK